MRQFYSREMFTNLLLIGAVNTNVCVLSKVNAETGRSDDQPHVCACVFIKSDKPSCLCVCAHVFQTANDLMIYRMFVFLHVYVYSVHPMLKPVDLMTHHMFVCVCICIQDSQC